MISVSAERVIYLRNDIALRAVIYLRHIPERILHHTCTASISYDLSYIILQQRYIITRKRGGFLHEPRSIFTEDK